MIKISNPATRADYADNAEGSEIVLRINGLQQFSNDPSMFRLTGVTFAQVDDKLLSQALGLDQSSLTDQHTLDKVLTHYHTLRFAEVLAKRIKLV